MVKIGAGFALLPAHGVGGGTDHRFIGTAIPGELFLHRRAVDADQADIVAADEHVEDSPENRPEAVLILIGNKLDFLIADFIHVAEFGENLLEVVELPSGLLGLGFEGVNTTLNDDPVLHEAPAKIDSEVKAQNGVIGLFH